MKGYSLLMQLSAPIRDDEHTENLLVIPHEEQMVPCGGLIKKLITLAAFLKELENQSHLIHLNYEGSNFLEVHAFLKDQYEAHVEQFDVIGEFVRSLDFWMPMCTNGLREALPCFQHVDSHDGRKMLTVYYQNLEDLLVLIENIEPTATELKVLDVANYMAELMSATNKAAWFIKATLRGC